MGTDEFQGFGMEAIGGSCASSGAGIEINNRLSHLAATILAHLFGNDPMAHIAA